MENNNYSEIKRKLLHFFTILYPILYNILPTRISILISGLLVLLDIIIETIRLSFPKFNEFILKTLKGFYREHEKNNISTLIWTFSGAFLTIFIFHDKTAVVTVSLLYMVFGDSAAGLIGSFFGRLKFQIINNKKSFEGSFSCFMVCFICGLIFLPWQVALIGAIVATIIEVLPLPLNDNFWLPIISGFVLTFLKTYLF